MIEDMIRSILYNESILPEDIPDIGLYMDQVTTLMDNHLQHAKRYEDDKIMTKTMINNYTKNRLLPPSDKKKYSRKHVLLIIMIYYMKNILSINDIQTVLEPLTGKYFNPEDEDLPDLSEIYQRILTGFNGRKEDMEETLNELAQNTSNEFKDYDLSDPDRLYLDELTLICNLSFDVYIRKQMIEKLIDHYRDSRTEKDKKKKKRS